MKASKTFFGLAAAALFMGASSVQAATVTPVDLPIFGGGPIASSTSDFITSPVTGANDIGDLLSEVYLDNGIYTYVYHVSPAVNNVSEFNLGFEVLGFNGIAGFDFAAAGGSNVFAIELDNDGTLDWNTAAETFDIGDTIAFFFQSTYAPSSQAPVSITNSEVGSALGFAMVPTPTAAVIGLPMLGLLSLGRRRRAQK